MDNRPLIISVGGEKSGIGKTTLGAALTRYLTAYKPSDLPPVYTLRSPQTVGVIKYTRTVDDTALIDDPCLIQQHGKDTSYYHASGASCVLWLRSPRKHLEALLTEAMKKLSQYDVVIVEGNSPIEFLHPDGVICIVGSGSIPEKSSARKTLQYADVIAVAPNGRYPDYARTVPVVQLPDLTHHMDSRALFALIEQMDDILTKKTIISRLTEQAENGKISCSAARMIAEELGVAYALVGSVANELQIKIKQCELGCF